MRLKMNDANKESQNSQKYIYRCFRNCICEKYQCSVLPFNEKYKTNNNSFNEQYIGFLATSNCFKTDNSNETLSKSKSSLNKKKIDNRKTQEGIKYSKQSETSISSVVAKRDVKILNYKNYSIKILEKSSIETSNKEIKNNSKMQKELKSQDNRNNINDLEETVIASHIYIDHKTEREDNENQKMTYEDFDRSEHFSSIIKIHNYSNSKNNQQPLELKSNFTDSTKYIESTKLDDTKLNEIESESNSLCENVHNNKEGSSSNMPTLDKILQQSNEKQQPCTLDSNFSDTTKILNQESQNSLHSTNDKIIKQIEYQKYPSNDIELNNNNNNNKTSETYQVSDTNLNQSIENRIQIETASDLESERNSIKESQLDNIEENESFLKISKQISKQASNENTISRNESNELKTSKQSDDSQSNQMAVHNESESNLTKITEDKSISCDLIKSPELLSNPVLMCTTTKSKTDKCCCGRYLPNKHQPNAIIDTISDCDQKDNLNKILDSSSTNIQFDSLNRNDDNNEQTAKINFETDLLVQNKSLLNKSNYGQDEEEEEKTKLSNEDSFKNDCNVKEENNSQNNSGGVQRIFTGMTSILSETFCDMVKLFNGTKAISNTTNGSNQIELCRENMPYKTEKKKLIKIIDVTALGRRCMLVHWQIMDSSNLLGYKITVDGIIVSKIGSPQCCFEIICGFDTNCIHSICVIPVSKNYSDDRMNYGSFINWLTSSTFNESKCEKPCCHTYLPQYEFYSVFK